MIKSQITRFSGDRKPWQLLGTKVEGTTWAEAIVQAKLDWEVAKSPVQFNGGDKLNTFTGQSVTYRKDNGVGLGIVSDKFPIIQNKVAGQVLDAVVGEVGAHYDSAGYFGKGEKIYALIKLPNLIRVIGDDVVEEFLLAANGHDGTLSFSISETTIRPYCMNTLLAAIRGGKKSGHYFRVKHFQGMTLDVEAIRAKMGFAKENFDVLGQAYQAFAKKQVSAASNDLAAKEYFKKVIEYPELTAVNKGTALQPISVLEDQASTRMKNRLEDLLNLSETGRGTEVPGVKGSVWGLFNAATEYATWFNGRSDQGRAQSNLFGSGAQMRERAYNEALALVK